MIYFDNNATTQIAPEVFSAMEPFLKTEFGNPSSTYELGRTARRAIESARENLAELIGANSPAEIIFTSGGTESDNLAILGTLEANPDKRHIITTRVEHEAVRRLCEKLSMRGYEISWIEVNENGALNSDQLRKALRKDTAIVSVMLANNETGIIFPMEEIAEIVHENSEALFHADGINAAGKIPINLRKTRVDLFSVSGHKFHAPKGVGALYLRDGVKLNSTAIGGGQERGRRAGTEAVHQIVALGAAASLVKDFGAMIRVRELRDKFEDEVLHSIPSAKLNGTGDRRQRLPNTSSISFPNLNGELILAKLNDAGVCVSTRSACNSETHEASPILAAMNIPYERAMGTIRFSLGRFNSQSEVDFVVERLKEIVKALSAMSIGAN